MSEVPKSIVAARVTNVRARLIGSMLIILTLLSVAGILYSMSLSRLDQAVIGLEEMVVQTDAPTDEQQTAAFVEIETARRSMREVPLAWGLLIAIAALSTTAITIHSIAQPAERLTEAVGRLAGGNLEERVQVEWADEFGRLATAFNEMANQLQLSYAELERQVAERTADLAQRNVQLEAAAQVARDAAEIQDVGQLLEETVHLISDRFGFYHTGIFLLDEAGEYAVLRAASSEGGRRMLARGHRLRVGQEGIVGYVTGRGAARVASDVGADAVFFNNPDLPETRSEMALPLRAWGKTIGALDVQSTEAEAFSEEDVAIVQTMADQVAVAISNARLFQRAQESLEAERRAYGTLSREAWKDLLQVRPGLGYHYDKGDVAPLAGHPKSERPGEMEGDGLSELALPVRVRGHIIGAINARKPADAGGWTTEEVTLLETLTEQLGMALESARLYQDAQRRAAREQLTGEITDKMRRAASVEDIVQTAVDELFSALGTSRAFVRLGAAPSAQDDGKDAT